MSMSAKLRSLCTRLIRGVPDGYIRADADAPKFRYLPSTQLPADIDRLIEAELVAPWRTDQDGVQWYKAADEDLAAVAEFDEDQDADPDADDFDADDSDLVDADDSDLVEAFDSDDADPFYDEDGDEDEDLDYV